MKGIEDKPHIPNTGQAHGSAENTPVGQSGGNLPSFSNSITRSEGGQGTKQIKGQSIPQLKEAPVSKEGSQLEGLSDEAALAILQAHVSKATRGVIKSQIEANFKIMKANSDDMIKKLDEQIEKMEKAEKKSLASKILGWLGAALSIVVGVATMIAGGAGAGLIAAGVAAMTIMTLEETGVMAKAQKALAEAIEKSLVKNGMDAAEAKKVAGIIATVTLAVAAIAVTVGPAFSTQVQVYSRHPWTCKKWLELLPPHLKPFLVQQ